MSARTQLAARGGCAACLYARCKLACQLNQVWCRPQAECFRFLKARELASRRRERASRDDTEDSDEEDLERQGRKGGPRPRPRVDVDVHVHSLAMEEDSERSPPLYVGTTDGRLLVVKIGFDKNTPTCQVMQDVPMTHGPEAAAAPVAVATVRDKIVAAVSRCNPKPFTLNPENRLQWLQLATGLLRR
jgi:hypothetical protein